MQLQKLKLQYESLADKIIWCKKNLKKINPPDIVLNTEIENTYARILTFKKDCHIYCRKIQLLNVRQSLEINEDELNNRCNVINIRDFSIMKSLVRRIKL